MYVAFKTESGRSLIWPSLCDSAPAANAISHENKSLENPANIKINKMYGIVEIASDGDMIIIIMNSTVYMSLNKILLFAKSFSGKTVSHFLNEYITKTTKREIHSLVEYDCGFTPADSMTEAFKRRHFPVSMYSPQSWRMLQMAHGVSDNWMVNIIKKQMLLDGKAKASGVEAEQPYDFLNEIKTDDLDTEMKNAITEGKTKIFAALALKMENSYTVDQFLMWLLTEDLSEKYCKLATSLGARFIDSLRTQASVRKTGFAFRYDRNFVDLSIHVETLRHLNDVGMINEFMVYACTMLTQPVYIMLLRETDIISMITKYMNERPVFTDMVGIAMSYAMYYATRYEYDTTRFNATLDDPFVWTIDMAAAFPRFECAPGSHPYLQMGLKYIKLFSPWAIIDFNRRIVTSEEAIIRMNITTIRNGQEFQFNQIIPWTALSLRFTGSRMGTCGAILPQESEFKGDFDAYISNYVGTSEDLIDKAIDAFLELKTDDIAVSIDGPDANEIIADIFELCKKKSDIDIQFEGKLDDFDDAAIKLVKELRKYGDVFMVKRKKFRDSYSWTIFADFLRYTIDMFHSQRSSVRLITGFMTGYPRIYYNGNTFVVTSHYVCARVTGINIWYERMVMNDPVAIILKAITREQTSTLINFRECRMLEKWLEQNGMDGNDVVYGNTSTKNAIFWEGKSNAPEPLNSERHWIQTKWITPLSNVIMSIWNDGEFVIPSNHIFERYWTDLVEIQARSTRG